MKIKDIFSSKDIGGRVFITFTINLIKALFGFFISLTFAKGLGVDGFGEFSFLLIFCTSFTLLIDLGTSSAFYTFLSKEKKNESFFKLYGIIIFLQFTIPIVFILSPLSDLLIRLLSLDVNLNVLLMFFVSTFFQQQIFNIISQLSEVARLTFKMQIMTLFIVFLNLSIVMLFYHLGILTLINIICLNGFLYVLALLLYFLFIFNINDLYQSSSVSILKHISDVKGFCYPLIPYLLISSGYKFVDSWLLQYNSGYEQQGIFAISSKISALSMVLVSALVKVLWREVSYFEGKGERASSWKLYSKASLFITCIGMFFACFIWPFSGVIIELLLGPEYIDAIIPFTIMLFVPTYIGLGQLAGMYYYSIEETRLFSLIGGVTVILGGIASYLLLSNDFLALGSVGLSIKSLSFEIISVIAMILVLNKITSLSGFIKKHIILVSFFFVLSYVINLSLVSFTSNVTLKFIIYCVFYFCITSVFLLKLDDYIFDGEIKNTRLKLVRSIISDKK